MHRSRQAACLIVLALGVIACGLLREPPDPIVDGWSVGREVTCDADTDCAPLLRLARDHLDRRIPEHAAVVRASLHGLGTRIDPATGDRILTTTSGGPVRVAVFELEDGTLAAVGVGYPSISREPMVFDPAP